ncbi:MAG: hypothetical protein WC009_12250 [Methylotenera sp.]
MLLQTPCNVSQKHLAEEIKAFLQADYQEEQILENILAIYLTRRLILLLQATRNLKANDEST